MSKRIAIMQPYFFPYIGYFQLINSVDKFLFYDKVEFIRKKWYERNRIFNVSTQKDMLISLPIVDKYSKKNISEIEIFYGNLWQKKLLSSIYVNYKKSPYFHEVYPLLELLINLKLPLLSDFNKNTINAILKYLNIKTESSFSEDYFDDLEMKLSDPYYYENKYDLKQITKKEIRIFEICKKEGCSEYHNAIGGMELYDKKTFKDHGIDIYFINTTPYEYNQNNNKFFPNLSIIDVLMFNSKAEILDILSKYTLI